MPMPSVPILCYTWLSAWAFAYQLCLCATAQASAAQAVASDAGGRSPKLLLRGLRETHWKRPIITGCLAECGPEEQSCVTQCQVCVEKLRCAGVQANCSACLHETRAASRLLRAAGDALTDSGGAPLVHEGIRQQLSSARLEAIYSFRRLRRARWGVLQAQHQVEWIAAERKEEVHRLRDARDAVEEHQEEEKEWLERAKREKKADEEVLDDLRAESIRTKRQLIVVERRMQQAWRRVHHAATNAHANVHAKDAVGIARVAQRLRWKLRRQELAYEKQRLRARKSEEDASWFRRGLLKKGVRMARDIKEQVRGLREVRASEKASKGQLAEAKDDYRSAVNVAQNWTRRVKDLRAELEGNPLPSFRPSD